MYNHVAHHAQLYTLIIYPVTIDMHHPFFYFEYMLQVFYFNYVILNYFSQYELDWE